MFNESFEKQASKKKKMLMAGGALAAGAGAYALGRKQGHNKGQDAGLTEGFGRGYSVAQGEGKKRGVNIPGVQYTLAPR